MNRINKTLYILTFTMSTVTGFWHFFVPHMFEWYKYLPMQYENLTDCRDRLYQLLLLSSIVRQQSAGTNLDKKGNAGKQRGS